MKYGGVVSTVKVLFVSVKSEFPAESFENIPQIYFPSEIPLTVIFNQIFLTTDLKIGKSV